MKFFVFFMVLTGSLCVFSSASDAQWERVSAGIPVSEKINFIEQDERSGVLYAGTDRGLYTSLGAGAEWGKIDLGAGGISARRIAFLEGGICLATGAGLYLSQDRARWERVPGKTGLVGVERFGEGKALAWTEDELYIFGEKGFERTGPASLPGDIVDVAFRDDVVYLGAGGAIYCSADGCASWDKYTVGAAGEEEAEGYEEEASGEEATIVRKIDVSGPRGAVVATNKGVFLADHATGGISKVGTPGIPDSELFFALDAGECMLATAGKRVFALYGDRREWVPVFESAASGSITWLKMADDNGERYLYVSSENGIFSERYPVFPEAGPVFRLGSPVPDGEPGIREVQEMAIEYAEVSPEKIKSWRNAARWKAILPKLSVGYGESYDDNIEMYKSSTTYYVVNGPRDRGNDWDVDLSWDLSDLIWNESQTSIDVRSKLMVQLREDLLEEVTRLYFERKRLLSEMAAMSDIQDKTLLEKQLRVQELTAYIDALTGGGFSEAIRSQ